MKNYIHILLLLGLGIFQQALAQSLSRSVIGSTGSINPQLSYTVGETVIETGSSGTLILTQGFQQPDQLSGVFNDPLLGQSEFTLYPNPTQEMLVLEIQSEKVISFQVEFVDIRGRRVISPQKLEAGTEVKKTFNVSNFASGTYLLLLKNDAGEVLESLRFRKTD